MNNATPAKVTMPKAAQQLIDDATAANFKVTVHHDSVGVDVFVEHPDGLSDGGASWAMTTVYDGPLSGERLGFRTHGGKPALRFSHASARTQWAGHTAPRSVRQMRLTVGLPE
jgi:hypothetical protein